MLVCYFISAFKNDSTRFMCWFITDLSFKAKYIKKTILKNHFWLLRRFIDWCPTISVPPVVSSTVSVTKPKSAVRKGVKRKADTTTPESSDQVRILISRMGRWAWSGLSTSGVRETLINPALPRSAPRRCHQLQVKQSQCVPELLNPRASYPLQQWVIHLVVF